MFPLIGEKIVGDITAADLKSVLNHWMERGYAYTTVKKVHILLNEYFRYLTEEEFHPKEPYAKRAYDEAQPISWRHRTKSVVPEQESCNRVSPPQRLPSSSGRHFPPSANGKRKYQQAAAYILMLNTGLRTGELLGLLNSDIDLERRVLHLESVA